ncbi:MAG: hypothetical protein KKF68_00570 [Nanoarchaeota archaeon]|nr:hypothetical protein [Nanoarchaeota archaeon]
MQEMLKFGIGVLVLLIGIPIGTYLARQTKEELKSGQKWFQRIIVLSFIGAIISVIYRNDTLLFSFLFIAIVTSRSLKKKC